MTSLLLRNLFFTILQPGLVAGVFPYWIAGDEFNKPLGFNNIGALLISAMGVIVTLACIFRFAFEGKGTLSPADETKQLVIGGLYRYSRNPMYIGVMLILIGETIFTQAVSLVVYSSIIFICFNLFIILHEEPRLQRDFGDQYSQYRKKVRRWL